MREWKIWNYKQVGSKIYEQQLQNYNQVNCKNSRMEKYEILSMWTLEDVTGEKNCKAVECKIPD
jgi:hypothetical protein